jgi:4-amino-4-deoxy-L-arabinose transferase-like glycosyltransferase
VIHPLRPGVATSFHSTDARFYRRYAGSFAVSCGSRRSTALCREATTLRTSRVYSPGMGRRLFLVVLILVFVLGVYLRLVDLGGPSLWLDEILHLQVTESLSQQPWYQFFSGVREIKGGTENGALYYALQILGLNLASGEVGVRLLPAVGGILALPLMALNGYLLRGRLVALGATFLLAVSPLHVYYSREGRPYYLLMALALLLLFTLLQRGSRTGVWMAYACCLVGAYVGIQAIPTLLSFALLSVVGLGWGRRDGQSLRKSPYLHYLVAAILALGLSYGLYLSRSKVNLPIGGGDEKQHGLQQPFGEESARGRRLYESPLSPSNRQKFLSSMTTSGHPSVLMVRRSWVLLALSLAGVVFGALRLPREIVSTAGMFVLPVALSMAALEWSGRWYNVSYTSAGLPAFLLLVALGVAGIAELASRIVGDGRHQTAGNMLKWVTASALLLVLAGPNLSAARTDPHRKADWRSVAEFFDALALEDEPILVANIWPQICLNHYLQDRGRSVEFVNLWESSKVAEQAVAERSRGWLLTAGFQKSNDARAWMHQFVPVLKKREEEMALFFFPDFVTLLETRFAACKGAVFEQQFAAMGQRFDFGSGESGLQGRGWSYPERNNAGVEYQWAVGRQAELGLPIGPPRDARIRLRALPFSFAGASAQTLELWLNEMLLVALELPSDWSEHEIVVPERSWSKGANILYLRFGRDTSPSEVDSRSPDHRRLSVAFDYLEVLPQEPN